MIGLILQPNDKFMLKDGCFDGFYTYFASDGFTGGSRSTNWKDLSDWSKNQKMLFIPSVGYDPKFHFPNYSISILILLFLKLIQFYKNKCSPGYIDTRVRPWNDINTKSRDNGKYYDNMWTQAINANPEIISITSFFFDYFSKNYLSEF